MPSLHEHLKDRTGACYRQVIRSLEGLSEADARRGGDPHWRRYRYGTGLDGSVAGIVVHVAVWKHVAAGGVAAGEFAEAAEVRAPAGWQDLLGWLEAGQRRLTHALENLDPAHFDDMVLWAGISLPLHRVFTHMLEHDQYHAGQIYLLRQQAGHTLSDP
jgi:uncharacterized damage-inducible protein DinB